MGRMKDAGLFRLLCLWVVLLSLATGCSSGAHSTASRLADTSQPTDASQPIYLAQVSCWDTESCCIWRDPLTAANRCMVTPTRIAEVLNGVKTLHGATQARAATLKDQAQDEEDARFSEAAEAEGESAPEPPDCQGQNHHVISRPIAKALEEHPTLRGLYEPRDERYVAKAKDKESHCGYQKWHRDVDLEIIRWLSRESRATPAEFMAKLREIYNREDMLKRFPHGFGPAT
ncbi:Wall-associated protein precursor [Hyalangium rubrum]|uniref:Wall-associated protein n=1 Tax=Hyalangium rubrum TaxID=3103134 RepID=A0ABU5H4U6_9BACT|nr:Wall-associated protein precursor [Hyalangium sp. s54d21]MDY7227110.1 Wall-associated protein precursor [Hyalangium sp. s54d21]